MFNKNYISAHTIQHAKSIQNTYDQYDHSYDMPFPPGGAPRIIQYFSTNKKINDSLPVKKIDSAYKADLKKNNIALPFIITVVAGKENELRNSVKPDELKTNFTFVGLSN